MSAKQTNLHKLLIERGFNLLTIFVGKTGLVWQVDYSFFLWTMRKTTSHQTLGIIWVVKWDTILFEYQDYQSHQILNLKIIKVDTAGQQILEQENVISEEGILWKWLETSKKTGKADVVSTPMSVRLFCYGIISKLYYGVNSQI